MKLILKAKAGLTAKKVQVTRGGKTFQQTVYVRTGEKKKEQIETAPHLSGVTKTQGNVLKKLNEKYGGASWGVEKILKDGGAIAIYHSAKDSTLVKIDKVGNISGMLRAGSKVKYKGGDYIVERISLSGTATIGKVGTQKLAVRGIGDFHKMPAYKLVR